MKLNSFEDLGNLWQHRNKQYKVRTKLTYVNVIANKYTKAPPPPIQYIDK